MKKKLLENSLIYSGLQVMQGGLGFLLLPVYARFLSPDDFGIVSVVSSVAAFLGAFYLAGLNGAAYRFYFDYKDDQARLKRLWGTIITFLLFLSAALTFFLLIFGSRLLGFFIGKVEYYPYMFLGIIGAAFLPVFTIYQSLQQARHLGRSYGIFKFANFSVLFLLTVLFVVVLRLKALGPILAVTLTSAIFFILTLYRLREKIAFGIDWKLLKQSLAYSLPIIPHTLTGWVSGLVDRLLINRIISTAAAGIYNIGYLFAGSLGYLNCAINQAYGPWFFEEMKEKRTAKVKKFFILAMTLYITLALWLTMFAKEVLCLIAKGDFRQSWNVVGLLSFGNIFAGYYYFIANQLFYSEKGTRYIPVATISAALVGLLLNIILIRRFGMIGAAITMLLTNLITTLLVGIFARRIQPVGWDHSFIIKLIVVNACAGIFGFYLSANPGFSFGLNMLIKGLVIGLFTYVNLRLCLQKVGGLSIFKELLARKQIIPVG